MQHGSPSGLLDASGLPAAPASAAAVAHRAEDQRYHENDDQQSKQVHETLLYLTLAPALF